MVKSMGIYIKNMEMPSDCAECKMSYEGSHCLLVEDDNDDIIDGKMWRRCPLGRRPEWCPLMEFENPFHKPLISQHTLCKKRAKDKCSEYCDGYRYWEDCYDPS